jgi:hypothetical protein
MKHRSYLVADRAVRPDLVEVSALSLAFSPRLVEAEKPVAFRCRSISWWPRLIAYQGPKRRDVQLSRWDLTLESLSKPC